jgi:hypothetical protein
MSNSTYDKIDYSIRKHNCQCGESFSSLEELNEHTDFIIQHFI